MATRLEPEQVVRAALEVLDAEGYDGLTVRRIAERLGVQNPALYWHFRNKQEIVDRMAEHLLRAAVVPPARPEHWDRWLLRAARAFRAAMLSHREGARVLASADLSRGPMTENLEAALDLLVAAGFQPRDALIGILAVFDYTLGATYEEQADPVRSAPQEQAPPSRIASIAQAAQLDPPSVFDGAVELIISGLAQKRQRRPPGASRPGRAGAPTSRRR